MIVDYQWKPKDEYDLITSARVTGELGESPQRQNVFSKGINSSESGIG
jgi:hypothetical protein